MVKLPISMVGKPYWSKRLKMEAERLVTGRSVEDTKASDSLGITRVNGAAKPHLSIHIMLGLSAGSSGRAQVL
jgi:hypothetical protein